MKNVLLSVVSLCVLFIGCSKSTPSNTVSPTASFSWQSSNLTAPSVVVFTNTSTNATSYSWVFGDGGTSNTQNPTHTYSSAGTYTVTLIATGSGNNSSTSQSITITASTTPTASFTYSGSTYTQSVISFTNNSTNATSYSWSFGDGNTSTSFSPTHTYTKAGNYTVTLTATGSGGSNQYSQIINVINALTKVRIDTIIVSNITTQPTYNNNTFPAILAIKDVVGGSFVYISPIFTNVAAIPANTVSFYTNSSIYTINNITSSANYEVHIQRYGIPSYTELGYVTFTPSNYTSGTSVYPKRVTLNNNGTTMTLSLNWLP